MRFEIRNDQSATNVMPAMMRYRVKRLEKARIDVARNGPRALPKNRAEFKKPSVPPPASRAKMDRISGKTAAMNPTCSTRMRVKLITPGQKIRKI